MGNALMRHHDRGFTLVELLVVITIIGILMAIILPSIAGAQRSAREAQERKQLTDVNTAWKTWASSHKNSYPIPGLARRQRFDVNGNGVDASDPFVAGSGREEANWNDHASLLSLCIMEGLITPGQLVSPNEYSDSVYTYTDYRYESLGVADGDDTLKWDHGFSNDLLGETVGYGHNSYGIMPLAGERRRDQWDRPGNSSFAVIGTRGPVDGDASLLNAVDASGTPQTPSNSAYLMAKPGAWRGILVYADGHSDIADGFYPQGSTYKTIDANNGSSLQLPDNIFKADVDPIGAYISNTSNLLGSDILLTHTQNGDDGGNEWSTASEINPFDISFTPIHD
jgi:prepilin-type N-terminal cleavage/methylation domain-containing protein